MQVLTTSAAASNRLNMNEKGRLIDENGNSNQVADYTPSISQYLSNQNHARRMSTYFRRRGNNWSAFHSQRKEESAFFRDAVLIQHRLALPQPLTTRRRITQAELTQALEMANSLCLEESKLASKQRTVSWLSPAVNSIPDDIKQKIKELKTKHSDSIENFINRLSTLLSQQDIERLGEPGREFNIRLREIRDELTLAEYLGSLKSIKSATHALDTLASDLSTLSTTLYQSGAPDVQKTGARLTISMLISGLATSLLSAGVAFLFVPGTTAAIIGIIVASVYGSLKFRHVQQESTCQEQTQEWDQARASLHHIQTEIKDLDTQIQQVEENTMDKLNLVINHCNHLTSVMLHMQRQIDDLKAQQSAKADTKLVIEEPQQERTNTETTERAARTKNTSAIEHGA